MVAALNTHKNRDLSLLDFTGEVLQVKHDIVYFSLKHDKNVVFLKCEKGAFRLNFKSDIDLEKEMAGAAGISKLDFKDYVTLKKL